MNTFEEVIRFAIKHEEHEEAFYRTMAERAENADLKEHLLEHARQEVDHKQRLMDILTSGSTPSGDGRLPDSDLKISDYALAVEPIDTENIGYQDALVLAAKQEREAERLYRDMAARVEDAKIKELFLFLAEQEGKHRNALEKEFDDLQEEN
ncbi:MAG: ferritin family protein [Magnetococcales bacterium]|nr:ferritin family protein [Magnetococcales bacterium]